MSKLETIDVVLPFHRVDVYLTQAIRSIKNQVGCKVNLILVDDRYEDSILPFEFLAKSKLVRTGGVGYGMALKSGLQHCTSKYIAFQDSDDISKPNRLSLQLSKMKEENADLVYCNMRTINRFGVRTLISRPIPLSADTATEALLVGSFGADSTWLLNFENLPNFFQFSYKSLDWATALVNFASINIRSVNENLYLYRQHSNQMTSKSEYFVQAFKEIYPLWRELNSQLNLPYLNQKDAATIAFPIGGGKWNLEIQNWSTAFIDRMNTYGEDQSERFEAILGQRVLQSVIKNGVHANFFHTQRLIKHFVSYQTKIQFFG